MNKFWNWTKDLMTNTPELVLEGEIASETWWGDEVTPKLFKDELNKYKGKDISVWINSPGGDVIAGSQIYTMLKEHTGKVNVKIDGLAASSASFIAMAGDTIQMSPTAMMMIHLPSTFDWGDKKDFQKTIARLEEVEAAIINAYELKTKLPRDELAKMMEDEMWMNAYRAKELGFIDEVLYTDTEEKNQTGFDFSKKKVNACMQNSISQIQNKMKKVQDEIELEKLKIEIDLLSMQ
jgi:ATP-dependent Clp protease protease subunit